MTLTMQDPMHGTGKDFLTGRGDKQAKQKKSSLPSGGDKQKKKSPHIKLTQWP